MPNLFIIAGCNGAGKTTASYSLLPEMLECKEFVNADEIAKGISPFNPESAQILAGRLMLNRIHFLIEKKESFALETTLSTKTYISLISRAKNLNYSVSLLFFWLDSVDLGSDKTKTP